MSQDMPTNTAFAVFLKGNDRYFMFDPIVKIGRSPAAFIVVLDSLISRTHCIIERSDDNKFIIRDMSTHGTFVNGKRLELSKPQELHHHDEISLANKESQTFRFLINRRYQGLHDRGATEELKSSTHYNQRCTDLDSTQLYERRNLDKELNHVEIEISRLKEEMKQKLQAQEEELKREQLKVTMELSSTKGQAEEAQKKLMEIIEERRKEKERFTQEIENKISEVKNKEEELQKTKSEMEQRHQIERDELEKKCKADIEELKRKMEIGRELEQVVFDNLQSKLKEAKEVLVESEMEQQRLFEAKVEVETKLESKINDLTKEKDCKVEELRELEKKLKDKEEFEEKIKREIEGLEDDMMCSICTELYIEPTALDCGHMFCSTCISEWKTKKSICPMCRAKIKTTVRIFNMDSVIERNIRLMPEEARLRREALIAERKGSPYSGKHKHCHKKRKRSRSRFDIQVIPTHLTIERPQSTLHTPPAGLLNHLRGHERAVDLTNSNRIQPVISEPEGEDPFQAGWIPTRTLLRFHPPRSGDIHVEAIDLTNVPTSDEPPRTRFRTHTVTSAGVNVTVDLTTP